MIDDTKLRSWSELYPDGRIIYYEGECPDETAHQNCWTKSMAVVAGKWVHDPEAGTFRGIRNSQRAKNFETQFSSPLSDLCTSEVG
jgi:hypothetical protein